MTKKARKKQIARLRALREKWHQCLGMLHWKTSHNFHRGEFRMKEGKSKDAVGACYADWRYCEAVFDWNLRKVARVDDEDLELIFVHEMMHAHLAELRMGRSMDHEERVATMLARAFLWTREAGRAENQPA